VSGVQWNTSTEFGAFLDPVADKLMVSTALVLLASDPPAPIGGPAMVVPVLVIIGREIAMSSLREWAASSAGGAHQVGGCQTLAEPHVRTQDASQRRLPNYLSTGRAGVQACPSVRHAFCWSA